MNSSMSAQSSGWSLSNPMTPQGMMAPTGVSAQMGGTPQMTSQSSMMTPNNMMQPMRPQSTNAKKLTSADIESLLG